MENFSYSKHPDTHKTGGLNINEKDAGMVTVLVDIFKQLGKKILEGSLVDLLKMSRPARITSPLTQLMSFANDLKNTELMDLAALQIDPIERMKYVTTYFLSGMHVNPIICKSKAPFNPILGETHQVTKKNGTKLYLEQTCHHPPTSHYILIGPNDSYKIFGYAIVNAQMTGVNSVKGWREGKNFIIFQDGTKMNYNTPEMRIGGIIMGDRTLNYNGNFVIKDYKNKIESNTVFNYREVGKIESVKNSITGLFKSKSDDTPYDHMNITFSQVNSTTKQKDVVCEGHGSWLGQIYIDSKKLWSYEDKSEEWKQEELDLLPSDSTRRQDLISLQSLEYEKSQAYKDELENLQRKDKKNRESNIKKN